MNKQNIKRHLISIGVTFISVFFMTVAFIIKDDTFVLSKTSLYAVIFAGVVAGVRAVAKIVYEITYNYLSPKK